MENYKKINQIADHHNCENNQPDFIVAASFGHKIPRNLIEDCNFAALNVHGSILPDFRGATPLQHAIMTHRKFTGVTLQIMDPKKIDTGDIVLVSDKIELCKNTFFKQLKLDAARIGANLLTDFFNHSPGPEFYLKNRKSQPQYTTSPYAKIVNYNREMEVLFLDSKNNPLIYDNIWAKFRVYEKLNLKIHKEDGKVLRVTVTDLELVSYDENSMDFDNNQLISHLFSCSDNLESGTILGCVTTSGTRESYIVGHSELEPIIRHKKSIMKIKEVKIKGKRMNGEDFYKNWIPKSQRVSRVKGSDEQISYSLIEPTDVYSFFL